jgi:hypothetical protein
MGAAHSKTLPVGTASEAGLDETVLLGRSGYFRTLFA